MKDEEARKMMEYYAGNDFDKARIVTHEPLWEFSGKWSAADFLGLITDTIAAIPKECRDSAQVTLEDGGYDSGTSLRLTYSGPESEETVLERVRSCEEYVLEVRERDRALYEYLKKKFEGSTA